jgi:hypothetical protein
MSGKTITSRLIVSLLDRVSGPAAKAGAALEGLKRRAAFPVAGFTAGAARASAALEAQTKKIGGHMDTISAAAAPLALGSLFGFHRAYEFEKSMNLLSELGSLTKKQRLEMEDYLQVLNRKYPQSLSVLARSMIELKKAGLSMAAAKGSIGSAMDLAVFGEIEPAQATAIMAAALHQAKLPMNTVAEAQASAKRVADAIVFAANKSATDVRLMGETFKYVLPVASAFGMTLEQVAAMAMIMANSGIKGSEAGIAIRSAFVKTAKGGKELNKVMAQLGLNLNDFKKKGREVTARGLVDVLAATGIDAGKLTGQIEKALNDPELKAAAPRMVAELTRIISAGLGSSSVMDKDKLAETISETITGAASTIDLPNLFKKVFEKGGPDAASFVIRMFDVRQASRLMTLGTGNIEEMHKALLEQSAGYAEKGAAAMLEGTVRPLMELSAALEGLFVNIAKSGVFEAVARTAEAITAITRSLSEVNPAFLKWGTYAVMAGASLGILKTAIKGVVGVFGLLRSSAGLMRAAGLLVLGPWGSLAAILGTIAAFNWGAISARWKAFSSGFSEGWADKIKIPDSVGKSWRRFASAFERTTGVNIDLKSWREMGQVFGSVVARGVNALATAFETLCGAMTKAIGLAGRAKAAFSAGSIGLKGSGFLNVIPGAAGITGPLGKLQGKAAGGPVIGGHPYVVGEVGPELFVPRSSGSIVPNHKLAGGGPPISIANHITINSAAGDARSIADAVAREIERRTNDLLRGVQADFGLRWT